jgi:hypothetical protein
VTELKVDSIFVVEDLGDRYVEGVLFHESNFAFGGYEVSAVNPDGRGIFYMPVAPYDVGRSVLVVRSIPLGTPRRDESLTWEANVIAFDVTR